MNPLDGLPPEALQVISIYLVVGIVVFTVLGLKAIDDARKSAPVTPVVVARRALAWVHCPNGHCKAIADRDVSCPVCEARLA